ncbi:carboxypeptidase-like regulatory domain-containing protein [Deinococcus sp. HMF7604]|uniref:carboxypeptidase-like regulatory domain-containing protein n=1 Tax=Deinococcus betulae TaxID=2873312 RepID=UPI001CC9F303|nr:carboxypeptidase-like regulatory domain-containing protein [Deinococcus betulae]MBZ9749896.1 carboxypeptidase-like regulatory domain-containing protein [Deinococcus betulae]
MRSTQLILTAFALLTLSACGGSATSQPAPASPGPQQPAPTAPGAVSAWTMTGTVKTEAGEPLAGVRVFADHTAFYNMNAEGVTDAQGRYTVALAHQPGSWAAGAYMNLKVGEQTFEARLKPNDDTSFDGSKGAVRDFTFKASDAPAGKVNTYIAHSNVELDYDTLVFTFTPDGPNVMGSTAPFTRPFVDGYGVQNVPLGRYRVSAVHVLNGTRQQLLLSSDDQEEFATSVLALFHDNHDRYGITMELSLKNPE